MMNIKERIYSGIVGKAIGVRLGAPIEPYQWDYDSIKESFGNITGYLKDSRRFAADDDTNGPIFFVRSLIDEPNQPLTSASVSRAWLNYARDGQGMFWWGGEGISTEHTAYNHLKNGIEAPNSGSCLLNTKSLSEQVGGQIFVDSWGLVNTNNIEKAMEQAELAASVSHDGEALEGAKFIAGMIAGSFSTKSLKSLIEEVLLKLDQNSEYVKVSRDIIRFYEENPEDFRKAYEYVAKHYSYTHYEGACHIIPNQTLVLIGLLYGEEDFSRSIEITCMCGWDTDSNAGIVGTILGVWAGLDGIPTHYKEPINDIIIASSMSPTLNIVNIPCFVELLYGLSIGENKECRNLDLIFNYKGSSSGLQIENEFRLVKDLISRNNTGTYNLLVDNLVKGDSAAIYYQTFYQKSDFGDNRYDPVFAPLVYSGQDFIVDVSSTIKFIDDLHAAPYIELANGSQFEGDYIHLKDQIKTRLQYRIPDTHGHIVKKIGIKIKTNSQPIDGNGLLGRIEIHRFLVEGNQVYNINSNTFEEGFLDNVVPFSNQRVKTKIANNTMYIESEETGISITGNYFAKNLHLETIVRTIDAKTILVPFRVKGLEDYYYLKIEDNKISIFYRKNLKDIELESKPLSICLEDTIEIKFDLQNSTGEFKVNGQKISTNNINNEYGHFGLGVQRGSICVEEIKVNSN